jgi:hypothetical protein
MFNAFKAVEQEADELMNEAGCHRFLTINAPSINGSVSHISVVYEQVAGKRGKILQGAMSRYAHLKIDEPYKDMLRVLEKTGVRVFVTDLMEDSLLKQIYKKEKIKSSIVVFVGRIHVTQNRHKLLYLSFNTLNPSGFEPNVEQKFAELASKIRNILIDVEQIEIEETHY